MDTRVKCCWCGWHGFDSELNLDEHRIRCYCPMCGQDSYIMELPINDIENEEVLPHG